MAGLEDIQETLDSLWSANTLLKPYLWQVWDRAQVEGLEDVQETLDNLGSANTLPKSYLWQVWDRAQVKALQDVKEALDDVGFANILLNHTFGRYGTEPRCRAWKM